MSSSRKMLQAAAGNAGGDFYPYTVDYSARLDGNNYLYRTYGGNTKTFTLSFWCKRAPGNGYTPGYFQAITGGVYYSPGGYYFLLWPNTSAGGRWADQPDPTLTSLFNDPSNTGRDFSAWYHYVFAFDSTQATSTDRMKVWVNGVQQPWTGTYPPLNHNIPQFSGTMYIARDSSTGQPVEKAGGGNAYGYLAEMAITDGQYYSASDFGEFKNGVWIPKDLSGLTFGTKGFWLDFKDSSNFGNDVSGNNLDFTAVGFQTHDQMIDTPTNNFATYNPIDSYSSGLSEGNLKFANGTGAGYKGISTFAIPDISDTQKYYVEYVADSGYLTGIVTLQNNGSNSNTSYSDIRGYYTNGNKYEGTTATAYGASYTTSNVLALLVGNGSIEFFKDGVSQGVAFSGLTGSWKIATVAFGNAGAGVVFNYGQNGTFNGTKTAGGNSDANGIGDFKYTVPTGALALCTANLPEPTIGPNSTTKNDEVFDVVLYTGNGTAIGSGGKTISDYNFQPDMVWIKDRSSSTQGPMFTVTRGPTKYVNVDGGNYEVTNTESLTSFTSTGFTLGSSSNVNASGNSYFSCAWKGGTEVSNTDGSITSNVSVNTDTGISIVEYTGTGTAGTIGHGLGVVPDFIDYKRLPSADSGHLTWLSSDPTSMLYLSYTDATYGPRYTNYMNAQPTTSTIPVTTTYEINASGIAYQAMCFAEKENFSRITKYTANNSTDGPFIYCGFLPKWVLIKSANLNSTNWLLLDVERDTYNVADHTWLISQSGQAESTANDFIDILSNGIKVRSTNTQVNSSGGYYLIAFAENPFKYSNAR